MSNLELKGSNINMQSEDILELLSATDQIDAVYGDERLTPIGNWGGDVGRLVSFYV